MTFANVTSLIALFVALGGTSYAALTITGKNVKNSSLTGADIKNSTLTTKDVKDRSLLANDFKSGQLPQGPQGLKGDKGDKGDTGTPGAPGTARAYAYVNISDALVPERTKGFTSLTHTNGSGLYCLTLDPALGIDKTTVAPTVTIEYNTSPGSRLFAFWAKDECDVGQIAVRTANEDAGPGTTFAFSDEAFTIIVP